MTEAEWLASDDHQPMFEYFHGQMSERKLRLFGWACCERIRNLLAEDSRAALDIVARFADGQASESELRRAADLAFNAMETAEGEAVYWATSPDAWSAALDASHCAAGREAAFGAPGRNDGDDVGFMQEHAQLAELLRDIFGNPFRPVAFDPRWHTTDVVALAQSIYDDRAFDRLPVLADALMDAGCEDGQVISHCRAVGPHVRGCWVVDLVLGKT